MHPEPADVLSLFFVPGDLIQTAPYGSGLINDSFLCEYRGESGLRRYLLQRVNAAVFRDPEAVMANIEAVTSHVAGKLQAAGVEDPSRRFPSLVRARSGAAFVRDKAGAYWRMFHFLESGVVVETVADARQAFEVGRGLGMFQSLVADLPTRMLQDTLPGFHHTPLYLQQYDEALRADVAGRAAETSAEAAFVNRRRSLAPLLTAPLAAGDIPLRVVHNDPKVSNIMIDRETGRALCMLDLDTVKPGIVHFDFGDCIRSAANPGGEDADLQSVRFDLALFKAIAEGYLLEAGRFLTRNEIDLLPLSIKVITLELGLRFLADHLRGDSYFKIRYAGQNLHRCRVQFRLLECIEDAERDIAPLFR